MSRIQTLIDYTADRIQEPSTWQGIGFIVAACGSKFGAGLDWGQAAALGGFISAILKSIFPDKKK